jgi:choice-of-anchor B domain-containing protein
LGVPGGTAIVDITTDNDPRQVAYIPAHNTYGREQKVYRNYAYSVSDAAGSEGVQIIDLSGLPASARLVRTFNYTSGSKNILRVHTITLADGFMYLNGCPNWPPGGTLIFDLRNDPENPQFVGEYQPRGFHDCYVLGDTIYAAGNGLHVADARNKSNVRTIFYIQYPGAGTHNVAVTRDRRYALTTDESSRGGDDIKVWDLAAPLSTTPVARFTVNPTVTAHNVFIRGDYAYSSWYNGYGLQIWNISNPRQPVFAAGYRTSTNGFAWQVYPFFPSGKIVLSDGSSGLWVFRFSGTAGSVPVVLASFSGTFVSGGRVRLNWRTVSEINSYGFEVQKSRSVTGDFLTVPNSFIPGNGTTTVPHDYEFTDNSASAGLWYYRLKQIDLDGTVNYIDPIAVRVLTSVSDQTVTTYALSQNYPNPFNPTTNITYDVPVETNVTLSVYNQLGQQVKELYNSKQSPGHHTATFDATGLASGAYFYRINAGYFVEMRQMLLVR